MVYDFERYGIASALDEERDLARLATHLDCTQQTFFQGAYSRHRRNPRTALTLCLLLGGFGAHAFYLGRAGSGALRLLFCWTLIPALIALCEAPRIASFTQDYNIALARRLIGMIDGLRVRAAPSGYVTDRARAAIASSATVPLREHAALRAGEADQEQEDGAGIASVAAASVPLMAALTLPALAPERSAQSEVAPRQQPTPLFAANPDRDHTDDVIADAGDDDDETNQRGSDAGDAAGDVATDADDALYGPEPVFAYSVASARRAPVRLEPLPATGADETLVSLLPDSAPGSITPPLVSHPPVFAPRRRLQRITVRKVALIDGDIVAEASATREAQMDADPAVFAERVRMATEEARIEALHQLAAIAPQEVVQRARQEFEETGLRTSTDAN